MTADLPDSLPAIDAAELLDHLGDGVVVADDGGSIVLVNLAAEKLLGWPRSELIGLPLSTIVPERLRRDHVAGFARFLHTRSPHLIGRPVRVPALCRDGSEVEIELTLSTLRVGEQHEVFLGSMRDLAEQVQLERELALARYVRASAEVTSRLASAAEATDLRSAAPYVLEAAGTALGWEFGALWEITGTAIGCVDVWEAPDAGTQVFAATTRATLLSRGVGVPGTTWAAGEALWFPDVARMTNFPRLRAAVEVGLHTAIAFPVTSGGRIVGVCEFFGRAIREPDQDLLLTVTAIGAQIGQYVERKRVEHAGRQRLEFLARAGELLDASLELDRTLENVAALAVPFLADIAVVHVVDEAGRVRVAVSARDDAVATAVRALAGRDPERLARAANLAGALLRPVVTSADVADASVASAVESLGVRSGLIVPLSRRGRLRGALSLAATPASGRTFGADDLALARDLARRAELALDNAQLFTERSYVARRLQESLLPAALPVVPGIELAVRYLAAGEGIEVGGDFYDVVPTRRGRWLVLVGDVCGKGVEAAAVAGLARHTARALALRDPSPAALLADLNEALLQQSEDGGRFCTVVAGVLEVSEAGATVRLASAGHPLPAVLRADGRVEFVGRSGELLGVLPAVSAPESSVPLGPGDALVLYTDGVVERRDGARFFGESGLVTLLSSLAGASADEIAGAIERTVACFQPEAPRDDLAVLVLKAVHN